ncbi:hypothetical protein BZG36_01828 [Bifiguratus adelaidae]|uniref:Anaphase-promoting complex subunit 4 WD40 domain-containing protein n=1 Tax=Bifiguratus adelaidae TaxID=1938954 RepID=A0A261Y2F6_9FUNG|nr:hypothetical protein BZG36_01828 [Bifiguratus adelaidae]
MVGIQTSFSELYKLTNSIARYSPTGHFLATAVAERLVIRSTVTLKIVALFETATPIQYLAWSPDSEFVVTLSYKHHSLEVWNVRQSEWVGKLEDAVGGVVGVRFAPNSRCLLIWAEDLLRINIWDLSTRAMCYIQHPKHGPEKGFVIRPDKKYAALAEARDKDWIGIYRTDDWSLIKQFPADTNNLEHLSWSPDGQYLAVWDNCTDYTLLIYKPDGILLTRYIPHRANTTPSLGLGIKHVIWSPTGQYVAVSSYDGVLRLLETVWWACVGEFRQADADERYADVWVSVPSYHQKYEYVLNPPTHATVHLRPSNQPFPKTACTCDFSPDGAWIAFALKDATPTRIYMFSCRTLRCETLLQHDSPIRTMRWQPRQGRLVWWFEESDSFGVWTEDEGRGQ